MNWHMRGVIFLLVVACVAFKAAPPPPVFEIDHQAKRVVCRDAKGKLRWAATLEGDLGRVRPPHLLADTQRVYVTHEEGVTSLDAKSGKVLWRSKGPNDRLLLSGNLLLATDCSSAVARRWLVARDTTTGVEVFRTALPVQDFDPLPIEEIAGLFLVQDHESPGGKGQGLIIDRKGKVRHRLDRYVVAGKQTNKSLVLVHSHAVTALGADGRVQWTIPFARSQWIAAGELLELPDGDMIAVLFGCISDSGVEVIRLNPTTGKLVWRSRCAPLRVSHSKYRHRADVTIPGSTVKVISRGSFGSFVEVLDLQSGRQIKRTRFRGEAE